MTKFDSLFNNIFEEAVTDLYSETGRVKSAWGSAPVIEGLAKVITGLSTHEALRFLMVLKRLEAEHLTAIIKGLHAYGKNNPKISQTIAKLKQSVTAANPSEDDIKKLHTDFGNQ